MAVMEGTINQRIKLLREHLGLSQDEFASQIGLSRKMLSRYEKGKNVPSEKTLRLIEQTFSVNPSWLREGKGEMFKPKPKITVSDPLEAAAEQIIEAIAEKRNIKLPPDKKRKLVKKLAELLKQLGEKEAIDLIDLAI